MGAIGGIQSCDRFVAPGQVAGELPPVAFVIGTGDRPFHPLRVDVLVFHVIAAQAGMVDIVTGELSQELRNDFRSGVTVGVEVLTDHRAPHGANPVCTAGFIHLELQWCPVRGPFKRHVRNKAAAFLRRQVEHGRQIVPVVDPGDRLGHRQVQSKSQVRRQLLCLVDVPGDGGVDVRAGLLWNWTLIQFLPGPA